MNDIPHYLIPLLAPVPPQLEDALGYPGQARFVAFYWEPAGDELMWDDGQARGDGYWWAWLEYVEHPAVAPYLTNPCPHCQGTGTSPQPHAQPCPTCDGTGVTTLHFGYSEEEAKYWFILDRHQRRAYAATIFAASRFLHTQWLQRPIPPAGHHPVAWLKLHQALSQPSYRHASLAPAQLAATTKRHYDICQEMKAWLDQYLPQPPSP